MKQTKTLWMALVAFLAIGFSSCNDEIADYKTELKSFRETLVDNTTELQENLDNMQASVDSALKVADLNHATYEYVDAADKALQVQIDSMKQALADHQVDIDSLFKRTNELNEAVIEAAAAAAAAQATADAAYSAANNAQNTANDALNDAAAAQSTANAAVTAAAVNSAAIVALTTWQATMQAWKSDVTADLDTTRFNASYALYLAKMDSIRIDALESDVQALKERDEQLNARDERLADSIQTLYDTLQNYVTRPELIDSLNHYLTYANNYADSLHKIAMDTIRTLAHQVDVNRDSIAKINAAYQLADSLLQDSIDALAERVDFILEKVIRNSERIDSICLELDTIKMRLDSLEQRVENIEDHLDRAIYSLAAQGSVNTVFGYAAIPGYALNVLIAYYGNADGLVEFPTKRTGHLVPVAAELSDADASMITLETGNVPAGFIAAEGSNAGKLYFQLNPAQANLDATEFKLVKSNGNECALNIDSVKASEDELTFGITINTGRNNAASLTGDQSANGFYEMYTSIDENNYSDVKFTIEESLKSAAKNMLEKITSIDRSGATAAAKDAASTFGSADLVSLAKGMYDQINGALPAYALQTTWTDSLGEHTVTSNYDIAATAVKPLSFGFLSDVRFPNIPKINPLDELGISIGEINFDMSSIQFALDTTFNLDLQVNFEVKFDTIKLNEMGDFTISVSMPDSFKLVSAEVTGDIDIDVDSAYAHVILPDGTIAGVVVGDVVVGDIIWDGEPTIDSIVINLSDPIIQNGEVHNGVIVATHYKDTVIDMGDYKDWMEKFVLKINESLTNNADRINDGVKNQLIGEIKNQVNSKFTSMIKDINDEVNGMISSIAGQLNSQVNKEIQNVVNSVNSKLSGYLGKANSLITRLNNIIDKVNNKLTSPNQFLQPVLLYNGADGGVHFMSQTKAVPSVFKGNGAITLYPTSFTGEIIAPAYKKYVAVVDVYKNGDYSVSAQNGNAACRAALDATNSGEYFNSVQPGGRYAIAGTFKPGYTYKILYSAVDFHGKIAQDFYYVTVK